MFKQRKNKRFNYRRRFQDFEELNTTNDFKTNWDEMRGNLQRRGNKFAALPKLLIILVVIIILMYILNGYIK